ncbi:hypothetical protein [Acidithiobacillus sp. AMEEHan]|uniref:hypothetical protein n=1 Tax=Acidithiobacillus sp. AMEEHan TaxID=2994951 RepID=UPI0027E4E4F2|nr:hypothetical protein [Acidithiobacillus sp. AMEEHan]
MDNRATLLAALRRVRHYPAYHSFMATQERERIKRDLQKRLLRLRRGHRSQGGGFAFLRNAVLSQILY